MGKKTRKNTIITKIAVATFIAVFSLASAFAGTIAWFSSTSSATVTGGSFTVQTPTGIQFELYHLIGFDTNDDGSSDKDGNYSHGAFIGYETVPNPGKALFEKVDFEDVRGNPTNITHLWPAHRLTYAMLLPGGNYNSFTLKSWEEDVEEGYSFPTAKIMDPENPETALDTSTVSLTWATNIYSKTYGVTSTGNTDQNILNDISTGFNSFKNETTDKFTFSQVVSPAVNPSAPVQIATGTEGQGTRVVLYFSIEFSNDASTFYNLSSDGSYYYKDENGNSNCYKRLSLFNLVFNLA